MEKKDLISEELRKVEKEIDNYYLNNALTSQKFGFSSWYLLAGFEDIAFSAVFDPSLTKIHQITLTDNIIVQLQHPLKWLWLSCEENGKPQQKYDDNYYEEASKLADLALKYDQFYLAYSYASHGWSKLTLDKNTIRPTNPFLEDLRYEVYSRILEANREVPTIKDSDVREKIKVSVSILGDRFFYRWDDNLIKDMISLLEPSFEYIFDLPSEWNFPNYSLSEFRCLSKYLIARCYIHKTARIIAAQKGIIGAGYSDSLIVITRDMLEWDLCKYSNVSMTKVRAYIEDLTYGNRNIRNPDPAIQPLVKVNKTDYIIMPSLFIGNSIERNFVILINRIPDMREIYLNLVNDKENLMREKIQNELKLNDFSYFSGNLSTKLPDVDLAIIDNKCNVAYFLELKWFVSPAEPREIIEKSEEIQKGIRQLLEIKNAIDENSNEIMNIIDINKDYKIYYILVSENYIGTCIDQHELIPVIQRQHLIQKINSSKNLSSVANWLSKREYLPVEGINFIFHENTSKIGDWGITWYHIETLSIEGLN